MGKFQLWRSTSRANRTAYVGQITTPDGLIYRIDANVIEQQIDGKPVKHFEGRVYSPHQLNITDTRRQTPGRAAPQPDLLTHLDDEPFDDSPLLDTQKDDKHVGLKSTLVQAGREVQRQESEGRGQPDAEVGTDRDRD